MIPAPALADAVYTAADFARMPTRKLALLCILYECPDALMAEEHQQPTLDAVRAELARRTIPA